MIQDWQRESYESECARAANGGIQCFLVKATNWCAAYARRYASGNCKEGYGYHNGMRLIMIDKIRWYKGEDGNYWTAMELSKDCEKFWPKKCDACDYVFKEEDTKQTFHERLFVEVPDENFDVTRIRLDEYTMREPYIIAPEVKEIKVMMKWWTQEALPAGAIWWSDIGKRNWFWDNKDRDEHLYCKIPGNHDWNIESRCSNCDKPDDRMHRCWIWSGTVPNITVGKNGNTCGAGAGSVWGSMPDGWHGWLKDGKLVPA